MPANTQRYPRIVLHAGLHKTGTTSIQETCFRHRDLLQQHGIVYPVFHYRERQVINHSDPLAALVSSQPKAYGMFRRQRAEDDPSGLRKAFTEQLQALLESPQAQTLLLSAEMVADFTAEDLHTLHTTLLAHSEELQLVAYLRSPASSMAGILQQRALAGSSPEPHSLVDLVKQRYSRLKNGFGGELQLHNFHEAAQHPCGLVGHFLQQVGLPDSALATIDFTHTNTRMSAEAYRLMAAINRSCPTEEGTEQTVQRRYHDLRPLNELPGQPFHVARLEDPDLVAALQREGQWLEQELGWEFPDTAEGSGEPLWQMPTLLHLEAAVSRLDSPGLRAHAAAALREEAAGSEQSTPSSVNILNFIAARIDSLGDLPRDLALEKLGADYFKFAALQIERASPELALCLMTLAGQLRPGAHFIEERIGHYLGKL